MAIYIRSTTLGRYVGQFIGLGLFEESDGIKGTVNDCPIEFESVDEAQRHLDSWDGGPADCFVSEEGTEKP